MTIVESIVGVFPVSNVPELFDVIGTHIFVVNIICMLPYIYSQNRNQARGRLKNIWQLKNQY